MKVYLDNCCYNRLFDDRSIINNYLERESILILLELKLKGELDMEIIYSDTLLIEASRRKDLVRRQVLLSLIHTVGDKYVSADDDTLDRARMIRENTNIRLFDSIHLALSEVNADILLTTDMKFLRNANRYASEIRVMNPVDYLREVISE